MFQSRPFRSILLPIVSALAAVACSSEPGSSDLKTTGSLSVALEIGNSEIDEVAWDISGGDMEPMSGKIDTSAPGATASIEVFGLPATTGDDYTITMAGTTTDGETTCDGSADFGIDVGQITAVMVFLNCKGPERFGGVRVNGKLNVCAELTKATAAPLQTSVGNDIDLTSQAEDAEGDPIAYNWTAMAGSIADSSAPSTTYTCQEAGDHTITISVTDNDAYCNMATWTFPVTCVPDEAECQNDEDCEAGHVCEAGQCVPEDQCKSDAECDDGDQCTVDICTAGECSNPNQESDVTCDQDGGVVCDGNGNCVECNDDAQCDMGEVCTANACVLEVECMMDSDCDDGNDCTDDLCTAGECSNPSSATDTACTSGGGAVCDGNGNCVECNDDAQCTSGQTCESNMCESPAPTIAYEDNFDDGVPTQWFSIDTLGTNSIEEVNGRVEFAIGAEQAGLASFTTYRSVCIMKGDFDMQVDYELIDWPAMNGIRAGLGAFGPSEAFRYGITRIGFGDPLTDFPGAPRESYIVNVTPTPLGPIATSDFAGTLRLERVGTTINGYYRSTSSGGSWILVESKPGILMDDAFIDLSVSFVDLNTSEQIRIALDNFVVSSGQVTCEGCGDGIQDQGESCDDGNVLDGDGCSRTCALE